MGFLDELLAQLSPPKPKVTPAQTFVKQVEAVRIPDPVIIYPPPRTLDAPVSATVLEGLLGYDLSAPISKSAVTITRPGRAFEIVKSRTTIGALFDIELDGRKYTKCAPGFFMPQMFEQATVIPNSMTEKWGKYEIRIYEKYDYLFPTIDEEYPWTGALGSGDSGGDLVGGADPIRTGDYRLFQDYNSTSNTPSAFAGSSGMPVGKSGNVLITCIASSGDAFTGGTLKLWTRYDADKFNYTSKAFSLNIQTSRWTLTDQSYVLPAQIRASKLFTGLVPGSRIFFEALSVTTTTPSTEVYVFGETV